MRQLQLIAFSFENHQSCGRSSAVNWTLLTCCKHHHQQMRIGMCLRLDSLHYACADATNTRLRVECRHSLVARSMVLRLDWTNSGSSEYFRNTRIILTPRNSLQGDSSSFCCSYTARVQHGQGIVLAHRRPCALHLASRRQVVPLVEPHP